MLHPGRLGDTLDLRAGRGAARAAALNVLAQINKAVPLDAIWSRAWTATSRAPRFRHAARCAVRSVGDVRRSPRQGQPNRGSTAHAVALQWLAPRLARRRSSLARSTSASRVAARNRAVVVSSWPSPEIRRRQRKLSWPDETVELNVSFVMRVQAHTPGQEATFRPTTVPPTPRRAAPLPTAVHRSCPSSPTAPCSPGS
jgi:hypothetical protein